MIRLGQLGVLAVLGIAILFYLRFTEGHWMPPAAWAGPSEAAEVMVVEPEIRRGEVLQQPTVLRAAPETSEAHISPIAPVLPENYPHAAPPLEAPLEALHTVELLLPTDN